MIKYGEKNKVSISTQNSSMLAKYTSATFSMLSCFGMRGGGHEDLPGNVSTAPIHNLY